MGEGAPAVLEFHIAQAARQEEGQAMGRPEDLAQIPESITGRFLAPLLNR